MTDKKDFSRNNSFNKDPFHTKGSKHLGKKSQSMHKTSKNYNRRRVI